MRWNKFFLFFLFIVSLSSVNALLNDDVDLWVYLPFDSNLTDMQLVNGDNSFSNSPAYDTTNKVYGSASLDMGTTNPVNTADAGLQVNNENFTITLWFRTADTGSTSTYMFWLGDGSPYMFCRKNTADIRCNLLGGQDSITTGGYADNNFYMLVLGRNFTHHYIRVYDTSCALQEDKSFLLNTFEDLSDATNAVIGGNDASAYDWKGELDEFRLFHRELTQIEESVICNNTELGAPSPGVTPSLTLSTDLLENLNLSNDNFPYYINFNGTSVNNTNIYDCNLLQNGTIIDTKLSINLSNNQQWNLTLEGTIGFISLSTNCTNENATDIITKNNIFVDTIEPTINIYQFTSSGNYYSDTDYNLNVTLNDSNLGGYYINIFQNISGSMTLKYNVFETDLINSTLYITNTTNSSGWCTSEPCNMLMNVTAYDDHNPITKEHEKYDSYIFEEDKAKFTFNDGYIEIYSDKLKDLIVYDEDNKYKIEFDLKDKDDVNLYIRSSSKIYLRQSKYQGHLMIPDLLKYFDLVSPFIHINYIQKISDYEYLINFDSEKDKVKTESLGDLNINTVTVTFTIQERPSLSDLYLLELLNKTDTQNNLINDVKEGINMTAYIFLFIFSLLFPFVAKNEEQKTTNQYISSFILLILAFLFGVESLLFFICIGLGLVYFMFTPEIETIKN